MASLRISVWFVNSRFWFWFARASGWLVGWLIGLFFPFENRLSAEGNLKLNAGIFSYLGNRRNLT